MVIAIPVAIGRRFWSDISNPNPWANRNTEHGNAENERYRKRNREISISNQLRSSTGCTGHTGWMDGCLRLYWWRKGSEKSVGSSAGWRVGGLAGWRVGRLAGWPDGCGLYEVGGSYINVHIGWPLQNGPPSFTMKSSIRVVTQEL